MARDPISEYGNFMKNSEYRLKRLATKQAGLTLLEVIISLSIIASATVGLNMIADRFSDDTKNTVTASQVRAFGEAAKAYIKDNYAAVQGVASATTPALIDVPTLIAAGNLTPGFLATNAFGQSMCALVLEPTANRLQAMVVAEGGTVIDDLSMGNIASVIGGSGGAVYSSDATVIRGAIGGWSIPTSTFDNLVNNVNKRCDGTAGNVRLVAGRPAMALWFENGDTSSAFLARDAVPGRPELNAMNTPIVMNSVQTVDGTCSTGAIARDASGGILSCQGGVWKSPGDGKCVGTSADLNLLQTDGRCYNGANLPNSPAGGDWVFVEVYRHINPANFYVAQRVLGMTGAAAGRVWQRNQQSGSQAGGWSAWVQQADSQVSIEAGGNIKAFGEIFAKRGQFSRDGSGPCCGDTGTLSLAENTWATGRKASISLHNGGVHEGNIELAGSGARRIRLYDNQGAGMGLDTTGRISTQAEDWGVVLRNGAGADNAQPTSGVGSAYVNDIYIRSAGKWASQIANSGKSYSVSWAPSLCSGCVATFAPNWFVAGTPQFIFAEANSYGGSNCSGTLYAQWRDVSGNVIRGYTMINGFNIGNGNDGGSGMSASSSFTIPMLNNAYYVDFQGSGCWGANLNVYGIGMS